MAHILVSDVVVISHYRHSTNRTALDGIPQKSRTILQEESACFKRRFKLVIPASVSVYLFMQFGFILPDSSNDNLSDTADRM